MKKFKMSTMKKRIIGITLSLVMIASMLPLSLLNTSAATSIFDGETSETIKKFVSMNMTEPEGYNGSAVANPYGLEKGQEMFLSEEHELFMYYSWDNDGGGNTTYQGVADTYNKSTDGLVFDDNDETGDFESQKDLEVQDSAAFLQAVSFAPTSSGRKNHVAYVGYNATQQAVYTWVVNATTGKTVSNIYKLCDASWMNDIDQQYEAGNFFAITAGKYDANDESESIVIYVAGQGTHARLYEMRYDHKATGDNRYKEVAEIRGKMLNDYYPGDGRTNNKHNSKDDNNKKNKLAADLATGDFNGDGADDLAVISYMLCANRPTNYQGYAYMPYLTIQYGVPVGGGNVNGYDKILSNTPEAGSVYVGNYREEEKHNKYEGTYEAGIAAGDVDGDGYDEIVVAGIKANVYTDGPDTKYPNNKGLHEDDIFDDKLRVAVFDANSGCKRTIFSDADTNKWTQAGFWDTDDVASKLQIECVATNGQNAAEQIFISGSLYEVKGSSISTVTTPKYFTTADDYCGRFWTSNAYVESVVAGNFDGNDLGREQLAFSIALKERSTHKYAYLVAILGGKDYKLAGGGNENTNSGQYGTASAYYMSDPENSRYVYDVDSGPKERLNCLVVDVDTDDDGTVARYAGHGYVYSDPEVLAVLQAAPYFGELGGVTGKTSYSVSQTYTTGTKSGTETSWSVGILAEATVGPVKVSTESQYNGTMTKSFEKSISTTYGSKFNAISTDSVVLSRTPFDVYTYDIWSKDGKNGDWTKNAMSFQIPREPSYIHMSVEDYNELVDYYNGCLDASGKTLNKYKLKKLNDSYLGQEGNPWGYMSDVNGSEGFASLSNSTYSFSHNGSAIESIYSTEQSETESKSQQHGYSFGLSIAVGGDAPGAGGWVGGSAGFDVGSISGEYTTNTKTSETTGEVSNINALELEEQTGIDDAIFKLYGFDWVFGKWSHDLGAAGNKVPVYGYKLSNITAPEPFISSLKAQLTATTTAKLTWKKPEDSNLTKRKEIVGYNIYRVMEGATNILINTGGLISADTTSYALPGLTPSTKYTFIIKCVFKDDVEGKESNQAAVITSGSLEEFVTPRIDDNGNWWIGENDTGIKAEGEDGVTPHIGNNGNWFIGDKDTGVKAAGVDGRGILSIEKTDTEGLVDTYTITYSDYTTTTFTVTNGAQGEQGIQGIQGIQGEPGADGHTPVITIDSDGCWCVDGVSTGIKAQGEKGDKGDKGDDGIDGINGTNGIDGINGTDGNDGISGINGKDGADGKDGVDGKDGLTPFIGENGNWWIGGTDTGVMAAIKGDGTEDVDGDGIISAKKNEKGELVLTLADGSTFHAVNTNSAVQAMADASTVNNGDMDTIKLLATIALILSALSLLWNIVALIVSLTKKKRT